MRHSALHLPETPILTISEPTERQLQALDRLQRYDTLTSPHLFYGIGDWQRVYKDLLKAQAIGIPAYFYDYARRKNVYYPLELRPIGRKLLAKAGKWIARDRLDDHAAHKLYRSTTDFFFDQLPQFVEGLSVRQLEDALEDDRCPQNTRDEYDEGTAHKIPIYRDAKKRWHYLVPDSFKSLRLDIGGTDATAHFHIENDRDTEPLTSAEARQSIAQKMRHYDQYFETNGPAERYGIKKGLSVLWLTTDEARAKAILRQAAKTKYPKLHAVKVFPDFKDFPPLTDIMVSQPWERAEGGPLDILKTLRETAARKQHVRPEESGARERVGESHPRS